MPETRIPALDLEVALCTTECHNTPVRREERRPQLIELPVADPPSPILDAAERPLRDLRISVTDRYNFRHVYCMPEEMFGPDYLPRAVRRRVEMS
jgi:hypothetical protein